MKIKPNLKTCIILLCITIGVVALIGLVMSITSYGGIDEAREIISTARANNDILFAETIDGSMMHVPVSDTEAIAESTGTNGSKGYYLFTQLDDCVTISDDIMVSQQQDLYEMMLSMIEAGVTISIEDCYVTTIKNTANIMQLMVEKWGLTEGQTMGALNNYNATTTDKVHMELIIKPDEFGHFEFAINLYVEDKAYAVYNGISLSNTAEKAIPPSLYDYRKLDGLSASDERAKEYLDTFVAYFKEVAMLITSDVKEVE